MLKTEPPTVPGKRPDGVRAAQVLTPHTGRADGGFTLLEIMIAVSIAAILMAIGIPAFVSALRKDTLRQAVSDVVEACSQARSQAILKGVPMECVIRAEDGLLTVQPAPRGEYDGDLVSDDQGVATGSGSPGLNRRLGEDVGIQLIYVNFEDQMEFPEARVRFFPNGTCDEFTMILFSEKGQRKISLDVVTALADVEVLR